MIRFAVLNSRAHARSRLCMVTRSYSILHNVERITIRNQPLIVRNPKNTELVPCAFLSPNPTQPLHMIIQNMDNDTLSHIRWMAQKDELGQDIFLIGYACLCDC
jgi:hypothetical protein